MKIKIGYEESDRVYYIPVSKVAKELNDPGLEARLKEAAKRILERE